MTGNSPFCSTEQHHRTSRVQTAEQSSPPTVFPSSHSSSPFTFQSPQIVSQTSPEREETEDDDIMLKNALLWEED